MSEELNLHFNGINGDTGNYLFKPKGLEHLSESIRGVNLEGENIGELKRWRQRLKRKGLLGVVEGIDPKDLAQTGWGVIFAHDDPKAAAIKDALKPLLEHRREQAAKVKEKYYREFYADEGYRAGESKSDFLTRHGAAPGHPADPEILPYYLLLVGDPEQITYRFQYQLDVQYAIGRIQFETLEEYASYAQSVVEAEKATPKLSPRVTFFGVQNRDDVPTRLSVNNLVKPLAKSVAKDKPDWTVQTLLQADAKKERLGSLLGGVETPTLLFTASHGIGFPKGSKHQLPHQGALICGEWPGPKEWGSKPIPRKFYFSAEDVSHAARLQGLIAFHFACYSVGTPALNDFPQQEFKETRDSIAPHGFVARLPQRLLGHPKGGALAVVGHIERAWSCAFSWRKTDRQVQVFQSTLKRLMEGHPVGSALEFFNQLYATLAADLKDELEEIEFGKKPDNLKLADMWTACNDARGYTIVGDPAVRLAVS